MKNTYLIYKDINADKKELIVATDCEFVLWVGNKRLFKRDKLLEYLMKAYSI